MSDEIGFLRKHGVTLFLDVGANTGQTGEMLRKAKWRGRIVSFEPIAQCFEKLARKAASDPDWRVLHTAIGREDGTDRIGVSENFASSSLLEATPELIDIHAPVRYTRHEEIRVARLDTLFPDLARAEDVVHLKIDTQGFERFVIEGAGQALDRIFSVRMEVAVSVVYEGEMVVPEAITDMSRRGFVLVDAWPAWRHPETKEVLHFDLLFRRRGAGDLGA